MKRVQLFLAAVVGTLICLSSCEKMGGGGGSLEGTYIIQKAEVELVADSKEYNVYATDDVVIDFVNNQINQTIRENGETKTESCEIYNTFLATYLVCLTKMVFKSDGMAVITWPLADSDEYGVYGEEMSAPAHYSIKSGVLDFQLAFGDPISFKIKSKSMNGLTLEPTKQRLKDFNDGLKTETIVQIVSTTATYKKE